MVQQLGSIADFAHVYPGLAYFQIGFRQLDFEVIDKRAVAVADDIHREFVQRKAGCLIETHLFDVRVETVLIERFHGNLGTQVLDVHMFGVELTGRLRLALHIEPEIPAAYQDGVEAQVDIRILLHRIFAGESVDNELEVQRTVGSLFIEIDRKAE